MGVRCAEIDGHRAPLFAGDGIVADSDPEAELAETQAKLRPCSAPSSGPDMARMGPRPHPPPQGGALPTAVRPYGGGPVDRRSTGTDAESTRVFT